MEESRGIRGPQPDGPSRRAEPGGRGASAAASARPSKPTANRPQTPIWATLYGQETGLGRWICATSGRRHPPTREGSSGRGQVAPQCALDLEADLGQTQAPEGGKPSRTTNERIQIIACRPVREETHHTQVSRRSAGMTGIIHQPDTQKAELGTRWVVGKAIELRLAIEDDGM